MSERAKESTSGQCEKSLPLRLNGVAYCIREAKHAGPHEFQFTMTDKEIARLVTPTTGEDA